ncbi:phage virion morphogenesis protein [Desulforhopalus singaporensis]|uniref:Uncharacterized protein n=1 Tax=Desulforhopalus singaporensis TaxID=91360 RepID=A0A1H0VFZ8_9BACT|nr:hypothetical protein [Desulforhopalus singaporensis]SDP76996.1 hypothetical protein SAMN05660330_04027 [Desulforhopalus singaporensis]
MSKEIFDIDKIALTIAERIRDKGTKQGRIPFLTGDLRKSIQTESLGLGQASVGSNLSYARAVHDGRPAMTIRPKKGKYLKFNVGGQDIFVKEVHQPARKGKPFLFEAIAEMENEGYDFLDPILEGQGADFLKEKFKKGIKLNWGAD